MARRSTETWWRQHWGPPCNMHDPETSGHVCPASPAGGGLSGRLRDPHLAGLTVDVLPGWTPRVGPPYLR